MSTQPIPEAALLSRVNYFAARQSFAFETTLSGRAYLRHIRAWQTASYRVKLIFLQPDSVDEAIARVAQRVRQGGHGSWPRKLARPSWSAMME